MLEVANSPYSMMSVGYAVLLLMMLFIVVFGLFLAIGETIRVDAIVVWILEIVKVACGLSQAHLLHMHWVMAFPSGGNCIRQELAYNFLFLF